MICHRTIHFIIIVKQFISLEVKIEDKKYVEIINLYMK